MSNEIICRECQTANPVGSKYCNNCGHRLPPPTSLLCPNCQTPNPRNRYYCDNCGTRLVQDELSGAEDEPGSEDAESSPGADKVFSLPMRPPGDTGELDPTKSVPDWLKTGEKTDAETPSEESGEEEPAAEEAPRKNLPRIEELGEEKKMTDDLPDWLVDEENEPIFDAPRAISTEHYYSLLRNAEEEMPDLGDDDLEDADLPDWLQEPTEPVETDSQPPSPSASSPTASDVADWLSDITHSLEDSDDEPPATADKADESETADWLTELGPPETDILSSPESATEAEPETELGADWLQELGPPETNILSEPESTEEVDADEDLLGWLAEFELPDTGSLAESTVPEEDDAPDKETDDVNDDWLSGYERPDTDGLAEPTDASPLEEMPTEELETADLPDWLLDMAPDTEGLAQPAASEPESEPPDETDDWLAEMTAPDPGEQTPQPESDFTAPEQEAEEPPAPPETPPPPPPVEPEEELPDWLTDFEESDAEPATEPPKVEQTETEEVGAELTSDWLTELGPPETDLLTPADEPDADIDAADAADWLDELGPPETDLLSEETAADDWLADIASGDASEEDEPFSEEVLADLDDDDESAEPAVIDTLPDWLSDMEGDEPLVESEKPGSEELYDPDLAAETALDWLSDLDADSEETEPAPVEGKAPPPAPPADASAEELDWLSEFAALEETELRADEADTPDESEAGVEETAVSPPTDIEPETEEEELPPETAVAAESEDDVMEADSVLDAALEEELPDWLDELGDPVATRPPARDDDVLSEGIPEWIADMKPGTLHTGSVLPSALGTDTETDKPLDELADDLGTADLPDWLQDLAGASAEDEMVPPLTPEQELGEAGWTEPHREPDIELELDSASELQESSDAASELADMLGDLQPASAAEQDLAAADIPDWIQALKPTALTGEAEEEPPPPSESSGPLSGLAGVISVEPIIAKPRTNGLIHDFTVTPEQEKQVTLLRQLARETPRRTAVAPRTHDVTSGWLRLVLAILLLVVLGIGLFGPNFTRSETAAPDQVVAVQTAVMSAAGKPVLVAFEYTPALAGELNVQARLLLNQLAANGSPIYTTSQYAAGTALAAAQVSPETGANLGFIPGEAIGLRQLGDCLAVTCTTLAGRSLTAAEQQALADLGLIIILTGERDSLVNWLEQVGTRTDAPMIAGITQSLEPVASPYAASGQLQGTLAGLPAATAYQQAFQTEVHPNIDARFNAQNLAQLLAAGLLLIGGLIYSVAGLINKEKANGA